MHHPRRLLRAAVFYLAAAGLHGCTTAPPTNETANTTAPVPLLATAASPCPTPPLPSEPPSLSPCIPHTPTFVPGTFKPGDPNHTLPIAQHGFDTYSWRAFVALNWPRDSGKVIGADGDNPTVWETYNESYQTFLPDGQTPHWGPPVDLPAACKNTGQTAPAVFRMMQKVSDEVLDELGQPFKTGPLIDQRGDYTRYAIHLNRDAFDYILNNKLYSKAGQKEFGRDADFPAGDNATPVVGAIVIKSAWRILDEGAGDIPGRYHKTTAYVYTPASDDPKIGEKCEVKTLGLVGFHIMHKTKGVPQWIWSTFEQVDNVRVRAALAPSPAPATSPASSASPSASPSGSPQSSPTASPGSGASPAPTTPPGLKPTYFNPNCRNCPVNVPPPPPWNPNVKAPPSQITRVIPIEAPTEQLNARWQALLRSVNPDSVWQYYELISTQWPTNAEGSPVGSPTPQFLANTTMETYLQGKTPGVSSSCIMCHNRAATTTGKFGDFSFLLQRAR